MLTYSVAPKGLELLIIFNVLWRNDLFFGYVFSYGLLGPSGCGKTTLLKCIVGTLKISRGHISVLGKPPAFPGHEVPGRMVGYMPQVRDEERLVYPQNLVCDYSNK